VCHKGLDGVGQLVGAQQAQEQQLLEGAQLVSPGGRQRLSNRIRSIEYDLSQQQQQQ
jgi:hypothetical protein